MKVERMLENPAVHQAWHYRTWAGFAAQGHAVGFHGGVTGSFEEGRDHRVIPGIVIGPDSQLWPGCPQQFQTASKRLVFTPFKIHFDEGGIAVLPRDFGQGGDLQGVAAAAFEMPGKRIVVRAGEARAAAELTERHRQHHYPALADLFFKCLL